MTPSHIVKRMICRALTDGTASLDEYSDEETSKDLIIMNGCLCSIRAASKKERSSKVHTMICGDSKMSFEMLLPITAALGQNTNFLVDNSLLTESFTRILKTMKVHGSRHEVISSRSIRTWGQLTAGTFLISAGADSWFLSGLLMALPLLKENSVIMVDGELKDREEIEDTLEILRESGIRIIEKFADAHPVELSKGGYISATFRISGGQLYQL